MKALILFTVILAALSTTTMADVPTTMTYQGILTDAGGTPVVDGNYSITFRLYDAVVSGNLVWEETQLIPVFGGVFTSVLGLITPLDIAFDQPYWVAISVSGGADLAPRTALTSTPYSFGTASIPDSVVTAAKVKNGTLVRSLNGLQDEVHVRAEGGASLSIAGDTLVINAAAGGASNTPWQVNGNDVHYTNGHVGVGTNSPLWDLHLGAGKNLLAGADTTGGGNRLMWFADLAAFRAGTVQNTQPTIWDRAFVGSHSFATGLGTWATGFTSTAMGRDTRAHANYSTAFGINTTASAYASLAIGRYNEGGGSNTTWEPDDPVFEVGVGSSTSDRRNALTVLKNGNVGIGTDRPIYPLEVSGRFSLGLLTYLERRDVSEIRISGSLTPVRNDDIIGSSADPWDAVVANTFFEISDARAKTAIEDIDYGLNEVMQMRPVRYEWKDRPEKGQKLGLIAQDLLPILSEVVKTEDYWPVPGEDEGDRAPRLQRVEAERFAVSYTSLIPVLIKAIQEQQAIIEEMQTRIDRLENR